VPSNCLHEEIRQVSLIVAETLWRRTESGGYEPDREINEPLSEETLSWECTDCGERVVPGVS
jgi:hypothetical protein